MFGVIPKRAQLFFRLPVMDGNAFTITGYKSLVGNIAGHRLSNLLNSGSQGFCFRIDTGTGVRPENGDHHGKSPIWKIGKVLVAAQCVP
jgi:hypothetical protein